MIKTQKIDHFHFQFFHFFFYSYLAPRHGGIKQKKCIIYCWASSWFLLLYSPNPHCQVWILIYRNNGLFASETNTTWYHASSISKVRNALTKIIVIWYVIFYGLPNSLILKLQGIQNACARLVNSVPKFCHVTPILPDLHWLPVRRNIHFKRILITFKTLNNVAPCFFSYLCDGSLLRFSPVKSSKTLGNCAIMFTTPKLWNNL